MSIHNYKETANSATKWMVLLKVLAIIFVVEIIIMIALEQLPELPHLVEVLLDGFFLSAISAPILYYFLVKNILEKNERLIESLTQKTKYLDSSVILSETDLEGNITFVNDKFVEITGYSKDELIGHPHRIINSGHHPKVFWILFWDTIKSGKIWSGDICNKKKDGSLYWVHSTVVPIVNSQNEVVGYGAIRSEITDKKQAETERNHSAKLASIGELSAGIGHEINNPLAIVKAYNQKIRNLLKKDSPIEKETLITAVEKIDTGVSRISTIVQGLRTFSRKDNMMENDTFRFNLADQVNETVNFLKEIFHHEGIEIQTNIEDSEVYIFGHQGQIQQILTNLLSNAKDALSNCQDKTIKVHLSKKNAQALIKITDSGSGIAQDKIERIFDPFFTTKDPGSGTGMGLSLVHSFVTKMNGSIQVESNPGECTTFTICFPLSGENQNQAV